MHEHEISTNASNICLACGACCRGMLHGFAHLQKDEMDLATELQLAVVEHEGKNGFLLPCKMLGPANECLTYERRPKACSDYRCGLLVELDEGKVTAVEATAYVARIVELENRLYAHMGPRDPALNIWQQFSRFTQEGHNSFGKQAFLAENRQALLDLKVLTVLCHRLQPSNFAGAARPGST